MKSDQILKPATVFSSKVCSSLRVLAVCGLLLPELALAGRGLVLNAYGPEQLSMGGADVAVSRDSHAINANPAGLTQIENKQGGGYVYMFGGDFKYYDSLGNDAPVDDPAGAVMGMSYAQRLKNYPELVASVGLYVQGGSGIGHDDLLTRFGTRDEVSFNIGLTRLVGGLSWQASEKLSVGGSVGVGFSQGRQKQLPNTSSASDPQDTYFGLRFDGGTGTNVNGLFGLLYRFSPEWTVAATYTSKSRLPLEGGTATINFEALGIGRVKYQNARINGIALPQEIDIGLAWRPIPSLILTAEFNWLDYSRSMSSIRFRADSPDNASGPAQIDQIQQLRWRDQYVYAFGFAYDTQSHKTYRGGFVVGSNPIRDETASPVFNLAQAVSIMVGRKTQMDNGWAYDVVFEHMVHTNHRYSNPSLGLGENSRSQFENYLMLLSISRSW